MILELKIKNFLSFKDEVTLSFEATKDKTFEEYQVVEVAPNTRILRMAVVYGANASGKSNLLYAFEYLREFWFSTTENKDAKTGVTPFLLDKQTPKEPSEFSLTFFIGHTKHLYNLVIDEQKVLAEKLYIYPGTQPALIFDRRLNGTVSDITFNTKRIKISEQAKEAITMKCLTNMSVLAAYNQVNISIPEMDAVTHWMKTQYNLPSIYSRSWLVDYSENLLKKSEEAKKRLLHFLAKADFNIIDINTEEIEKKVTKEDLSYILHNTTNLTEDELERLKKDKTINVTKTAFKHKIINADNTVDYYTLPKSLQSDGTLRTFGLAGAISQLIERNAFLAIDEIESSLHPRLIEFILEDFFKQKSQSQLLLTTHYDGLLEEDDLLRKDSIWFTNKKQDGSTDVYSLTEFKGLNRISSLQKAYKYGKFGAVPKM